jgi:arginine deiminase
MNQYNINSEVSKLETVIIHSPGPEVENMTPVTAERALYSDILNLSLATKEYSQFKQILQRVCKVFEIKNLLRVVLVNEEAKLFIIRELAEYTGIPELEEQLNNLSKEELCNIIIEGIPPGQKSLTNFLDKENYAISPLHNIFFSRDNSFVIGNRVYIGSMAKQIREPETILMKNLLKFYPDFCCDPIILNNNKKAATGQITIEGGDILVLSEDTLIIGIGTRTNSTGVDFLIKKVLENQDLKYVLVQELPGSPESFIHLDMVLTLISRNECVVYEPLILGQNKYHTILISIENRKILKIEYIDNLIRGLNKIGFDIKPLPCGGNSLITQEREQWQSGANFLAFDSGKLIGYERNTNTAEILSKNGYRIVSANEVLMNNIDLNAEGKILVTIESSELSRGGGGPHCMSMPVYRK